MTEGAHPSSLEVEDIESAYTGQPHHFVATLKLAPESIVTIEDIKSKLAEHTGEPVAQVRILSVGNLRGTTDMDVTFDSPATKT